MWRIGFTHAGVLWLATAAAVPLIIHLFSRQKPRVVRFPAVRFIRIGRRKTFHRTQFKQLLLLLMRMALIALFALLIARPMLRKGEAAVVARGADGTAAVVIIVDDSLSLNYQAGDATWFDLARGQALRFVEGLPDGVVGGVLTTSRPQGKLSRKLDGLAGRLAGLRPGTRSNPCWRALENAAETLRHGGATGKHIYVFTDMTPSAWAGRERRSLDLGADVRVRVVDCAPPGAMNLAVTELRADGEPPVVGAILALEARAQAWGTPGERTVQFEFDGRTIERRQVDLQEDEVVPLRFRMLLSEGGHHWGRISFLNPDGLPHDDARTFTVDVAPEVPVLCVEDDPTGTRDSRSFFFRLALDPWGEGGRGIFSVERVSPAQLLETPLEPFDAVALVGAGDMTDEAWRRLSGYVSGGGGLLVFAGPLAEQAYRTAAAEAVLPGQVGPVMIAPPEGPFELRVLRMNHPVMEAILASKASLAQARYRQCRRIDPVGGATVLMSLGAGLPALVLSEAGNVALFAAGADERWGEFAKTEPFAPFCHEVLLHLAGRTVGSIRSLPVGSQVPITYETGRLPTNVFVTQPGQAEPERLLPGTTPGRVTYWKTDAPGYYGVEFRRQDKQWRSGFAVNASAIESRLEKVPFEDVQAAITAESVELVEAATFGGGPTGKGGMAREMTPYLALLALALLAAESFLANRFYGSASAEPSEDG